MNMTPSNTGEGAPHTGPPNYQQMHANPAQNMHYYNPQMTSPVATVPNAVGPVNPISQSQTPIHPNHLHNQHRPQTHANLPPNRQPMPPPPNNAKRNEGVTPTKKRPAPEKTAPEEELAVLRLRQKWRSLASSVVVAVRGATRKNQNLDEMIQTTLKTRVELRKGISVMEHNLKGRTQELKGLEHLTHLSPSAGRKKRRKAQDKSVTDTNLSSNNNTHVEIEVVDLS